MGGPHKFFEFGLENVFEDTNVVASRTRQVEQTVQDHGGGVYPWFTGQGFYTEIR